LLVGLRDTAKKMPSSKKKKRNQAAAAAAADGGGGSGDSQSVSSQQNSGTKKQSSKSPNVPAAQQSQIVSLMDALMLKVIQKDAPAAGKGASLPSPTNTSISVLLHPEDMARIQVFPEDHVLLLVLEEEDAEATKAGGADPGASKASTSTDIIITMAAVGQVQQVPGSSSQSQSPNVMLPKHRQQQAQQSAMWKVKKPGDMILSPPLINISNNKATPSASLDHVHDILTSSAATPEQIGTTTPTNPTLSSSTPTSTSSQNQKKFSFDKIRKQQIAATSPATTPIIASRQESARQPTRMLVCPLGTERCQQLLKLISVKATRILLKPLCHSSTSSSNFSQDNNLDMYALTKGQRNVLDLLVMVKLLGQDPPSLSPPRFVPKTNPTSGFSNNTKQIHIHDKALALSLSFQGRMRHFSIVKCVSDDPHMINNRDEVTDPGEKGDQNDTTALQQQMRDLSLSSSPAPARQAEKALNDQDPDTLLDQLLQQYSEKDIRRPTLLHHITYKTKISFSTDDDDESNNNDASTTNSQAVRNSTIVTPRRVAGVDYILQEMHSLLLPALVADEGTQNSDPAGSSFPKGLLLFGATGVGKTAIAQQFVLDVRRRCKEASVKQRQQQVHIEWHHCSSLIMAASNGVGEAERHLSGIYRLAERRAYNKGISTLIVLDDVHLICRRRGSTASTGTSDRLSATLLALMDGITPEMRTRRLHNHPGATGHVVTLAITRTPSLLDPALRRAGRLDSEVEVSIPDDDARAQILKLQLQTMLSGSGSLACCEPSLVEDDAGRESGREIDSLSTIEKLARLAKGFTGADTYLAVKDACRMALLRNQQQQPLQVPQHEKDQIVGEDILISPQPNKFMVTEADLRHAISKANPSTLREVAVQVPTVYWDDIGGMQDVKQKLREAIEWPLLRPDIFEALNIDPPKGILLYGPPGCSKTLMARALATEGHMNFLAVKGPELLSKWLGESERALSALFKRARQASPCVVFLDEVDAIAVKRGASGGGGGERLLSQLLTELDGVGNTLGGQSKAAPPDDKNKSKPKISGRVVVVGATNRPDLLDPALTRPGRIDKMIYVGVPDLESRAKIIEISLQKKACEDDVNIAVLAQRSDGFSGAELVALCRDAAFSAIEDSEEDLEDLGSTDTIHTQALVKIGMRHLTKSIAETKKQITPQMIDFYAKFQGRPG
jgi:transitional endoplasmic reticulum ATPase